MMMERRTIFQLLAAGRINPGQAERLLAAVSTDRETLWALAGCAAIAAIVQLQAIAPSVAHLLREALAGSLPAMRHGLSIISSFAGGVL